jgi:Zn-dependent peptidase ImmA (M78 family)
MRVPDPVRAQLLSLVPDDDDRSQVDRFIDLCEGYAELERSILGDLRYDLPVHSVVAEGGTERVLVEEATRLASAAWRLLDRVPPIGDLPRALEEHSARVFEMPMSRAVGGVFLFAGEIAPSFLLNSRLTERASTFMLAHLYGHYLIDNDPYSPQVCVLTRPSAPSAPGGGPASESERRATYFAHEFLMPALLVRRYSEEGATSTVLSETFELPESLVRERMALLGLPEGGSGGEEDQWTGDRGVLVPERLVRLALEGIHADALTVGDFARALRLDERDALGLLRLSASTEDAGSEGETDGEEADDADERPVNGVSSPPGSDP